MALNQLTSGWKLSSPAAKIGLAVGALIVLVVLIGATVLLVHHFQDAAYQKREEQRQAERQQLEDEKAQLMAEKQKALLEAADAHARADSYKQVAESKRADKQRTIKELEIIEAEHVKHKQQAEAAGSSLSDSDLRSELCKRLAARGYPPCPAN